MNWINFRSNEELKALIQKALAQRILEHAQAFALNLNDLELLSAFLEELDHEGRREQEAKEAGGAGEGGVIIAPGRDVPPGGVLVEG